MGINRSTKKEVYKKINPESIKIWLPEVQQKTHFSCGAAVVHSICAYYGLGLDSHYDYFAYLETDETYGTSPNKIATYFKSVGICCKLEYDMTMRSLCSELQKRKPVILALQAYGFSKQYKNTGSGHYVVAIGFDKKNIFFEDPWLNCMRGYIPKSELLSRWHDLDVNGKYHNQLGIVAWKNAKPFYLNSAKKIP